MRKLWQTSETPSEENLDLAVPEFSKKETQRIIAWVRSCFESANSERNKYERQWFTNLAFFGGKQNIRIIDGGTEKFRVVTPPAPYYRARPVVNRIKPLIRTEISKLSSQRPSAYIIPASSDDRDLYAAQAGEQLWEHVYDTMDVHTKFRKAIFWTSIAGNGFLKTYWNAAIQEQIVEVVTPFNLFFADLDVTDIEDQPYVIHAANHDKESLEIAYGVKFDTNEGSGTILDESYAEALGMVTKSTKKNNRVLVIEMWIKPGVSKMMPNGGMITVSGDKILAYEQAWPYEHGEYPFIHFPHIDTGLFYGESTINDLIPLQREYNRTRGQIIEAKNKAAKPQLAAEQGSMDATKMTDEPGQIVFYRPGFQAPQPIPIQSLPSYVLEEQDRIKMDMDEISGQHEVSRGQVPAGVTAATAISFLQEQDDTKLSGTFDSIEAGMEKLAGQSLGLIKQFWDEPRMIKVSGVDQSFDVKAFAGSDLRDNTDIRMEGGSSLPTSRAAKQAFVMDLMKMGFIDPNKGLEVMEIGGINKIYEEIQVDIRQAQRENLRMAQVTEEYLVEHEQNEMNRIHSDPIFQQKAAAGLIMESADGELVDISQLELGGPPIPIEVPLPVPVNSWDDHRLHIEQHNRYRKSQAFENLDPAAKELFEAHVQAHVTAIMVGAQGAMGLSPDALAMANNPETMTEMTYREQTEPPGSGPTEMSQQLPPDVGGDVPPDMAGTEM